jgi:C4-dicarboxylate transporter
MIVVVIGVAVVLVHEILAQDVIGERVARLLVVIVSLGHAEVLRQPRGACYGMPDLQRSKHQAEQPRGCA